VNSLFAHGWPLWIGDISGGVVAVPVLAPFPEVAVHVVEPPGVRLLSADRMRRVAVCDQGVHVLFQLSLRLDKQLARVDRL